MLRDLKPDDFYDDNCRAIFQAAGDAERRGMIPDLQAVHQVLAESKAPERVFAALLKFAKIPTSAANHEMIIANLQDLSSKRKLSAKLEQLQKLIDRPNTTHEEIIEEMRQEIASTHTRSNAAKRIITLDELMSMELKPTKWMIPGILPEGISKLEAQPKIGKSWMAIDMAVGMALGGQVMGRKVDTKRVLFIGLEDSKQRLHSRIRKQSHLEQTPISSPNLQLAVEWEIGAEGLIHLSNQLRYHHVDFIVIDTYARFFCPRDSNDYGESTGILASLKSLVDEHKTSILLIHHTKKNQTADDFVTHGIGSTGVAGGVDTILSLSKKRNQQDGILRITGRDCEEQELGIHFDIATCRWMVIGSAAEITDSRERQEIIDILKAAKGSMGPRDIAGALGKNVGAVKFLLSKMVNDGLITRLHRGEYIPLITNLTNYANLANHANHANFDEAQELDFE
jgi:hypothetical protein